MCVCNNSLQCFAVIPIVMLLNRELGCGSSLSIFDKWYKRLTKVFSEATKVFTRLIDALLCMIDSLEIIALTGTLLYYVTKCAKLIEFIPAIFNCVRALA